MPVLSGSCSLFAGTAHRTVTRVNALPKRFIRCRPLIPRNVNSCSNDPKFLSINFIIVLKNKHVKHLSLKNMSSFPLAHVQHPGHNTYMPFPQGSDLQYLTFSILLSCIIFRYFISSASALAASLKVKKKVDVVKGEKYKKEFSVIFDRHSL